MKKLLTAIVISALCLGLCSGALADGTRQRVFDLADLLTDDEEAELQSRINELVAKDGQDIGIVTVEDESVMSTQEFADEFYENSGMGIGENRTGVLFCIDMYNRETYLTTTGDMIDIIDDQRREEIFDAQMEYLSGGYIIFAYPLKACFRVKAKGNGLALRRKGRFVMDDNAHIRFSLHAPDQQDAPCCGAEVDRT